MGVAGVTQPLGDSTTYPSSVQFQVLTSSSPKRNTAASSVCPTRLRKHRGLNPVKIEQGPVPHVPEHLGSLIRRGIATCDIVTQIIKAVRGELQRNVGEAGQPEEGLLLSAEPFEFVGQLVDGHGVNSVQAGGGSNSCNLIAQHRPAFRS